MATDGRDNPPPVEKLGHRAREQALMALATRQHGVVAHRQLLRLGFSPAAIGKRTQTGRLHRRFRGVYALGRVDLPVSGLRLAAVLACGDGACLSHISNAAHLGLRRSDAVLIDVTVSGRSGIRHAGIRVHRSTTLIDEDITVVDGVPCTSCARTLLDIAPLVNERSLERAVEQAEIKGLYDHRAILRLLDRSWGQPGSRRLGNTLGIVRPGNTITKSELEELMLGLCRGWGLPEPEVNAELLIGGERMQVDFLWRKGRVVVETDAFKYHSSRAAFRRDRRRDRLLELAGYRHARFADADFDHARSEIRSTLIDLLG
jgi:hypothetical protein